MNRQSARIIDLQRKVHAARSELRQALAEEASGEAKAYPFETREGAVTLAALFGSKRDLFVIHNMGTHCASCTMWADGFNGLYPHIADRASFVVASQDPPDVQATFAAARGWRFPMVSAQGTSFFADMGFVTSAGKPMPGVSAFQKQGDRIMRVSAAGFDTGDDYCTVWRLFDLLPEGVDGWRARHAYG